jgi:hypothetical protein
MKRLKASSCLPRGRKLPPEHSIRGAIYAQSRFCFLPTSPEWRLFYAPPIVITISTFSDINHAVKDARPATEAPAHPKNPRHKYI